MKNLIIGKILGVYLLVVLSVMIITVAVGSATTDKILEQSIRDEVRGEILRDPKIVSRLKDPQDLQGYIQIQIKERLKALSLDKPWWRPERLGKSLFNTLTFQFGKALFIRSNGGSSSVKEIILEVLPRTIILFYPATFVTVIIGLSLGLYIGRRPGYLLDKFIRIGTVISASFPTWWIGMIAILLFSFQLREWTGGAFYLPARATPVISDPNFFTLAYHMILPFSVLVLISVAPWAYVVKSLVISISQENFVLHAKAKGVPERSILFRHILRTASPPIILSILLSLNGAFSGAIITELVFDWPGMGRLFWEAISAFDWPVVLGLVYIYTLMFVSIMLVMDLIRGWLDPTQRGGE